MCVLLRRAHPVECHIKCVSRRQGVEGHSGLLPGEYSDVHAAQHWKIRGRTYRFFRLKVVPFPHQHGHHALHDGGLHGYSKGVYNFACVHIPDGSLQPPLRDSLPPSVLFLPSPHPQHPPLQLPHLLPAQQQHRPRSPLLPLSPQSALYNCILRVYVSEKQYLTATHFIASAPFPENVSDKQYIRYSYYKG